MSDAPRSAPSPTSDDNHIPGCPASVGVDRYKWIEPAQSFTQDFPQLDVSLFLPIKLTITINELALDRPVDVLPSTLPLYLSHCTLVI